MEKNMMNRLKFAFICIGLLFFGFLIVLGILSSVNNYYDDGISISDKWTLTEGNSTTKNFSLGSKVYFNKDTTIILERKLPDNFEGLDSLYFTSQNIAVKIYIDNDEIYEYGYDTGRINTAPGDFIHLIRLPEDCEGKNLRLEIYFPYSKSSILFNDVQLVDDANFLKCIEKSKMLPSIVCIFTFMIALVCAICELIAFRRIYGNLSLLYMSLFLMFFSVWSLIQLKFVPLLWGRSIYHSASAYILVSIFPITFVMYGIERFNLLHRRTSKVIIVLLHISFFAVQILNFTGIWEYAENVLISQLTLVFSAFYLVYLFFRYNIRAKNSEANNFLRIGLILALIMGLMDAVNTYVKIFDDYSMFSRFGMFMLTICVFVDVMSSLLNTIRLGELSEANQRNAYTDALTGIGNRMAFDKKIESFKTIKNENLDFGIILFDVNGLKYFNDTYGHGKGDSLIIESGRVIDRCCMDEGFAYRYGGDEFIIVVYGNAEKKIKKVLEKFDELLDETNNRLNWEKNISIAYGYEIHSKNDARTVDEILALADKKMYERKAEMKKR